MTPEQETKLRVVEALTRTDGSQARNDPELFIKSVAIITTFVLETQQKPLAPSKPRVKKSDKATVTLPDNGDDMLK